MITLVNDHEYHVLTFALYQTGTNEQPSRNVAIPLSTIFENQDIKIRIGKVDKIDEKNKKVVTKRGEEFEYDYLVLALGSESEDFGIPGVKEFAFTFKTLYDAATLRNQVKLRFENACNDKSTIFPLKFVIGGGGFTGTELAGELHKYCAKLAKQFMLPQKSFEVYVIQSGDQLLNGLDKSTAIKAKERLEKLHVQVILGSHITKVEKDKLTLENGQTMLFNLLIWTVGVRANSIIKNSGFNVDKSGKVSVTQSLLLKDLGDIFACGDCAAFPIDNEGHGAPTVAPIAIEQGKIIGQNIKTLLLGSPSNQLSSYQYHHVGYVVPVSGRFALARLDFFHADGLLGFIAEQFIVVYYLLSILPLAKALHRWNNFEMELTNED